MGDVVPFPKRIKRTVCVTVFLHLDECTDKEADRAALRLFDEVFECVEDIPDIAGTYWVADVLDS